SERLAIAPHRDAVYTGLAQVLESSAFLRRKPRDGFLQRVFLHRRVQLSMIRPGQEWPGANDRHRVVIRPMAFMAASIQSLYRPRASRSEAASTAFPRDAGPPPTRRFSRTRRGSAWTFARP